MSNNATVNFPFPSKGYDSRRAYADLEPLTTPACLNVRAHSGPLGRATGGARPALTPAYDAVLAGPLQWLGWLDCGYGDQVAHEDNFQYDDGPLSTRDETMWPSAQAGLDVQAGRVRLSVLDELKLSGQPNLGGDTWNNFTLSAMLEWNYATSGQVKLWAGSDNTGADGAMVIFNLTSTPVEFPGLGYATSISITLQAGGAPQTWSTSYGPLWLHTSAEISIVADAAGVRVAWGGREILSAPRVALAPCECAGFAMSKSNPNSPVIPDSFVDIRIAAWRLSATSSAGVIHRRLAAVAGNRVYASGADGAWSGVAIDSEELAGASLVAADRCNGKLFVLDGENGWCCDATDATNRIRPWTPRRGLLPTRCRMIANWRNRMVLAGNPDDPQNYYLSRQDDPWDFDYGQADAKSAVRGDMATAGRIDDPITALCPLSDETLVIGCGRGLWVLRGDPAQGGLAHQQCTHTGIVGPNAWTTDPQGNLYFLGEHGLYVMSNGGSPKNISADRIAELQTGLCMGEGCYATLAFDPRRWGVLVFVTSPLGASGPHWFYDIRNEAFFPERYPAAVGPTCAAYYAAEDCSRRNLLLGGTDGRIYEFDDELSADVAGGQQHAIDSYVWLRSSKPTGGVVAGLCAELASGGVDFALHAGASTADAMSAPAHATGEWHAGINAPCLTRARGRVHMVKLSNSAARRWSIEQVHASASG